MRVLLLHRFLCVSRVCCLSPTIVPSPSYLSAAKISQLSENSACNQVNPRENQTKHRATPCEISTNCFLFCFEKIGTPTVSQSGIMHARAFFKPDIPHAGTWR